MTTFAPSTDTVQEPIEPAPARKTFSERLVAREPLRAWAVLVGVTALTVQSLAYSTTDWFYSFFGVSPEEVGMGYADMLGRKALHVALLSIAGLLFLAALSFAVAFYGALGVAGWVSTVRDRWRDSTARAGGELTASHALLFLPFLVAYTLTLGSTGMDPGLLFLVFLAAFFVTDAALTVARTGTYQSALHLSLFARHNYSAARLLLILVVLAGFLAAGGTSFGSVVFSVFIVALFSMLLPRAKDLEEAVAPAAVVRLRRLYSRWFLGLVAVCVVGGLAMASVGGVAWLLDRNLSPMVEQVYVHGRELDHNRLDLNPLMLAAPKADAVEVRWVADRPPREFLSGDGTTRTIRLILFGQANGVAVFFDPATKTTLRLPASSLVMTSSPLADADPVDSNRVSDVAGPMK
jgi:hypothetical protein